MQKFLKMDGIGNDFVIFDVRKEPLCLTQAQIHSISARGNAATKGCDQVIRMERSVKADVFMRIHNPDGSESSACGNATRCIAWLLMEESGKDSASIETLSGILQCTRAGENNITVDMGEPKLDWRDIPLSQSSDTLHLPITEGLLSDPVAVNMGNPHMVFFVADAKGVDLHTLGPRLEHHPLFPERANVSVAEIINPTTISLRVWERGAGETLACGTGACATLVAAVRRNKSAHKADIHLPGGMLSIAWGEDNHVLMTGAVAVAFKGNLAL